MIIIAATTMIRTKSPAIAGMKYRSAIDTEGIGVGATVALGAFTANAT